MEELNTNNEQLPEEPKPVGRPPLLKILCILTFIGSGLQLVSNLNCALFYEETVQGVKDNKLPAFLLPLKPDILHLLSAGRVFFAINFILYTASVIGAYYMWKLIKKGFHVYTISQIVIILITIYYFKELGIPYEAILFSGMYVAFYSMNLKAME